MPQALASSSPAALRGLIRGVDHLTLPVKDLALAERFYVGLLGAELLERFDAAVLLRLLPERATELEDKSNSPLHLSLRFGSGPRVDLFLQPYGQPSLGQPHPHLAFEVSGADFDKAKEVLSAAGIPTAGPLRLGAPGQASLYFMDPFGNTLELATTAYPSPIPIGVPDLKRLAYSWNE